MSAGRNLLLDAGALVAIDRHPRGITAEQVENAVERGRPPLIPTVVFAQVWRNTPAQHALAILRRASHLLPFAIQTAHDVGAALRRSRTADVVDAAVVVAALEHDAIVLTSDPADLKHLAESLGRPLAMITV